MTFVDVETGKVVEAKKQNRPVLERGKKYVATVIAGNNIINYFYLY